MKTTLLANSILCTTLLLLSSPAIFAMHGPDFDGDGYEDTAMGMPDKNIQGKTYAGNVLVTYGSTSGLTADKKGINILNRSKSDIKGQLANYAYFGAALAWGDFNRDGFDDLVVGVPGDSVNHIIQGIVQAGSIQVFYGHSTCGGLCEETDRIINRASLGMVKAPAMNENFGSALASGDFNGDGYDDLAVGVPGASMNGKQFAGSVHIIYGSKTGLSTNAVLLNHDIHLDQAFAVPANMPVAQRNNFYGKVLASGDFNCDGKEDLAVGIPDYTVNGKMQAGAVHVIYGSTQGLSFTASSVPAMLWTQGGLLPNTAEQNDRFGFSLAVGNFNKDSLHQKECNDLAIGIPYESAGNVQNPLQQIGAVQILYGNQVGLAITKNQFILGTVPYGHFGWDIASGDFNQDDIADLMVGVPDSGYHGEMYEGSVDFLSGSVNGLSVKDTFTQGSNYVMGNPEGGDRLGFCLGSGNFNKRKGDELLACAPFDNYSDGFEQGIVEELYFATQIINNQVILITTSESAGWIYDECGPNDFQCKGITGNFDGGDYQHFARSVTKVRPTKIVPVIDSPQLKLKTSSN